MKDYYKVALATLGVLLIRAAGWFLILVAIGWLGWLALDGVAVAQALLVLFLGQGMVGVPRDD
ncbi:hypothetical protein [Halopelagius fulvigenes]|uniref:Uncharacterized protein n=1 Tax=Halopelagius fulvigenes TaxID=1198324 RepID=A0ABD5U4P4_9EURY